MAKKKPASYLDICGVRFNIISGPDNSGMERIITNPKRQITFAIRHPSASGRGRLVTIRYKELRRKSATEDPVVRVSFEGRCVILFSELQFEITILTEGEYNSETQTGFLLLEKSAKLEPWRSLSGTGR